MKSSSGDIAVDKIKKYLEQKNVLALETLIEVYGGLPLSFSSDEKKQEFKKLWNVDLKQG